MRRAVKPLAGKIVALEYRAVAASIGPFPREADFLVEY